MQGHLSGKEGVTGGHFNFGKLCAEFFNIRVLGWRERESFFSAVTSF